MTQDVDQPQSQQVQADPALLVGRYRQALLEANDRALTYGAIADALAAENAQLRAENTQLRSAGT